MQKSPRFFCVASLFFHFHVFNNVCQTKVGFNRLLTLYFGGGSGIIGSLLFIIAFIFFLSYSLFLVQFCSIFIIPFQVCRVILYSECLNPKYSLFIIF